MLGPFGAGSVIAAGLLWARRLNPPRGRHPELVKADDLGTVIDCLASRIANPPGIVRLVSVAMFKLSCCHASIPHVATPKDDGSASVMPPPSRLGHGPVQMAKLPVHHVFEHPLLHVYICPVPVVKHLL